MHCKLKTLNTTIFVLTVCILFFTACSVITSENLTHALPCPATGKNTKCPPDNNQENVLDGICYYLPMVAVHISVDLTNAINPALTQTITNWTITNFYSVSYSATNTSAPTNIISLSLSNAIVSPTNGQSVSFYLVNATSVILQDTNRHYILQNHHNAFYDDHNSICLDSNSFLSSVNTSNADETANIVGTLGQIAVQVAKGLGGAPAVAPILPSHIDLFIDPADSDSIDQANTTLNKYKVRVTCTNMQPGEIVTSYSNIDKKPINGVLYRQSLLYRLTIVANEGGANEIQQAYNVLAPNRAAIFRLSMKRGAFVTRTASIQFNNGFLLSADYLKPSEVNGFVQIPLNLANDAVSIVTNIIPNQVNLINSKTALNVAQTNFISSQQAVSQTK